MNGHLITIKVSVIPITNQLLRLRWRDIRLKEKRAYIEHTKNGEPRVLPLVEGVFTELKELPRPIDHEELVFPSERTPGA